MLYSTNVKIDNKTYKIRIGTLELIKAKEMYCIDIFNENELQDMSSMLKIFHVAMLRHKEIEEDFHKFLDWIDNSDISFEDLAEAIQTATERGLEKKIDKQKAIAVKSKAVEEKTKNA